LKKRRPDDELPRAALLRKMRTLWRQADKIWDECRNRLEFGSYVSADYLDVFVELEQFADQATTFLEWGSGLGVVTIMASRLGFEAYGIEVEPLLVKRAQDLALRFGPDAQFAEGSFIPDQYQWDYQLVGGAVRTETDSRDAYDQFDLQLPDFDLVYAYPWPEEFGLFLDIMRQCGGENALFLSYDTREGVTLTRLSELEDAG
jgi:hypothetical protein